MKHETLTPRTDAIAHRGYNESTYIAEMTGLARELERELAELRKNTSELIVSLQTEMNGIERELAVERALAVNLAALAALAAWKEARK
jgi:hypothetical protein